MLLNLEEFIENQGISISAFEKKISASDGMIRRALRNKTDIQSKWIIKISENYPDLNLEWLITGKGEMYKTDNKANTKQVFTINEEDNIQKIPLHGIQAITDNITLFDNNFNQTPLKYITVPNFYKYDGAIQISGDSMYPILKSGDIIMYKTLSNNIDNIFWGEMYLIQIKLDGEKMVLIKWAHKSDKGDNYIKLVSENKYHSYKDIHIQNIIGLALVKGFMRLNGIL